MRPIASFITLSMTFSLSAQTGPGGVGTSANNVLWLDANYGISHILGAVNTWSDRSGNANHAYLPVTIPLGTPNLVSNSVNGYPSLDFDGFDDQLWVVDHASLDLTQWHFFTVVTADLQKDYNAWMVKGDDSQENYELLSYSDGNMHAPIYWTDGTRTHPSSAGGQVTTTTFDIFEYSYSAAVGRDVYKNGTNIITDNENKTPQVNNRPLYIGNERSTLGREVNGDIAEVVAYNARLNNAERIMVNNYFAAKYARTLASNDLYVHDSPANGNFDHDVSGIGRVDASNLHSDSRGSGVVQIGKGGYSGLNNDEFLLWGHDNAAFSALGSTDFPAGLQGRLHRVWRVSEVNSAGSGVNVGNVDITWDLAGLGAVTASHLRLLVDTDGDGIFADETPISGATHVSGSLYRFSNTNALVNDIRFTLGTTNIGSTPLPVELVSFTAEPDGQGNVIARWITANERNSVRFEVQRSLDLEEWALVAELPGAGNTNTETEYEAADRDPVDGLSYYRLHQIDLDGTSDLSQTVAVRMASGIADELIIAPNPSSGKTAVVIRDGSSRAVSLSLFDAMGRSVLKKRVPQAEGTLIQLDVAPLVTGRYAVVVEDEAGALRRGHLIVAH